MLHGPSALIDLDRLDRLDSLDEEPIRIDRPETRSIPYAGSALNPTLGRLLAHCGFDRSWTRAEGALLTDEAGRQFLDFYAQYGAVALGHNAPTVVDAVRHALSACEPAMVQPYRARHAEALAERLAQVTGMDRCVFTTSGAEAVEAAIKLVRAGTGRPVILGTEGSFHGKTLGALAATGQRRHSDGFGPLPPEFEHVPFGDEAALAARLDRDGHRIAGFLVEPIQGERGVHPAPPGYLARARDLCTRHGVALVFDEIQTGLCRTGPFLACEHEGVRPDVVLLAKALGGGLFPLGACLATAALWSDRFALGHSSTFANNNIACRAGLAVVDALTRGGLCAEVARKGSLLERRLAEVAARHPRAVSEVRGRGLLRGVELARLDGDAGTFLSYLDHGGLLAYAVAATLAERHGLLVLPTLGESPVLRLTPPLVISDQDIERAAEALDDVCDLLERHDAASIARAMGALTPGRRAAASGPSGRISLPATASPVAASAVERAARRGRYAFIVHYTSPDDVVAADPSFTALNAAEIASYCEFVAALPAGVALRAASMRSAAPVPPHAAPFEADGFLIALGMLPEEMARRGRHRVREAITAAVDLAASLGAEVVGLGGHTAPYSLRGRAVIGRGPAITTGNTLTAVMAFEALRRVAAAQGRSFEGSNVAVVGARGSIGALLARLVARARPRRLILMGNPSSGTAHLTRLAEALSWGPDAVVVATERDRLAGCELILTATGAPRPALDGAPIRSGAIVCDVARPPDASPSLRARADVTVIDGGLVALPDPRARFGAGNVCGLPSGIQLACLAETILLALARDPGDHGIGDDISLAEADHIAALAAEHGFRCAEPMPEPRAEAMAEPMAEPRIGARPLFSVAPERSK